MSDLALVVDVVSAAELTERHVVVNFGSVLELTRDGVFVRATFNVTNWDLTSGRGYKMRHTETWHESHELCIFVSAPDQPADPPDIPPAARPQLCTCRSGTARDPWTHNNQVRRGRCLCECHRR